MLTTKQLESVRESTGTVNIWSGSIRSGKTVGSLHRFSLFLAMAPKQGAIVIIGRTRDSAWRNIVAPMQDPQMFGSLSRHVVGNYGSPHVTIMGRKCFIIGASDAKAEKVIRGLTVAGAYVDEVTTVPEEFFSQLLGRMSVKGAQLFGTTNPDNPSHWLKKRFLDKMHELPHWRHFHFDIWDNVENLGEQFINERIAEYSGLWYKRFIKGEWVAAEGAVYPMWDESRHIVSHDELPPMESLLAVGIDHGIQAPSVALALGIARGSLWLVDEWSLEPKEGGVITVGQQASEIRAFHATLPSRPSHVIVDPAAKALRNELLAASLPTAAASNAVLPGIEQVATLLNTDRLRVSDRCTTWINEVTGYSWDPKAAERGEDAPIKTADHALDAGRYAVASTRNLWYRSLNAA